MAKKQQQSIIAHPVHFSVHVMQRSTVWIAQLSCITSRIGYNSMRPNGNIHWRESIGLRPVKALTKIFTYFRAIGCVDKWNQWRSVQKGNYNPKDMTEPHGTPLVTNMANPFCPTGQFHLPHRANAFAPEGEPIPDIITDNITDSIIDNSKNCRFAL